MDAALVSCIVSTYKRDWATLKRAIRSIQTQSYRNIEIIIVNDAPEDLRLANQLEAEIQALLDSRIQYVTHKRNMGACAARNTGASIAKGEYLAFLDDDDEWLPDKIEKQIKCIDGEDVGIVSCNNYRINSSGGETLEDRSWPHEFNSELEDMLVGNFIGSVSFPLLRTSTFFAVGGFDTKIRSSQDTDMWIRMLKSSRLVHCAFPLVRYYVSAVSITTNIESKIQGYEYLLSKYRDDYKKNSRIYSSKLLTIGNVFLTVGKPRVAKEYFKKGRNAGAPFIEIAKAYIKGKLLRLRRLIMKY